MGKFLSRERFGQPQFLAGLLLLMFLGQCAWLLSRDTAPLDVSSTEVFRVQEGLSQWRGRAIAGIPSADRLTTLPVPSEIEQNSGYDPNHSPLWYLIAAAPLVTADDNHAPDLSLANLRLWSVMERAPSVLLGALLGSSLWYVARRLYGNAGGYIALTLYCFSPAIIRSSTLWGTQPEMGAAWGAFGAIFTAIAVAHTLYAPREVVLWNWRRILLLGLSLVLAVGTQFSLVVLVPVALGLMLYLAPTRRPAALTIWLAACAVGLVLLFASYAFRVRPLWEGLRHAAFFGITWRPLLMPEAYWRVLTLLGQCGPAFAVALPASLIIYLAWRRARYFGNTAPLLIGACLLLMGVFTPHYPGLGFQLIAMPFLFVFVSGVAADVLETDYRRPAVVCIWTVLIMNAVWNLLQLARVRG